MRNNAYIDTPSERSSRSLDAARLLSALANPIRLRILKQLVRDTACVSDFVGLLAVDQPKVSQHLAVLRESGLIQCRAQGRKRCYSAVSPERLRALLGCVEALLADRPVGDVAGDERCIEP